MAMTYLSERYPALLSFAAGFTSFHAINRIGLLGPPLLHPPTWDEPFVVGS